jgi:hypothetical protein
LSALTENASPALPPLATEQTLQNHADFLVFAMKTTTRSTSSIQHSLLRPSLLPIVVLSLAFALSPTAHAIRVGQGSGYNTSQGDHALPSLRSGATFNTAIGGYAMFSDTTGSCNAAIGTNALRLNTTGMDNTAIGVEALADLTNGSTNIALGYCAGINLTSGDKNIYIGSAGTPTESSTIRIGLWHTRTFIAGIRGVATGNTNAIPVVIDSAGQLGTVSSSQRFKKEIKSMDKASEVILELRPVTFKYKSDSTATPQFGLVAEEVEKVCPDLIIRDAEGKAFSVRYDAVNAMLLNEFLKEHRQVETQERKVHEQQATIKELKSIVALQHKEMQALAAHLKEQDSKIEKVSAQIQSSNRTRQIVANGS